ncbi:hypothetical protein [Legionella sp.]|uniref:hypothetical protein n=1 Tax=Legionella sp. TaxID=459 RepID=UPI000CC30491|nr:hypothetical protein [Legionella sp.]PJE14861.1 MAG: hypothetical protein CK430_04720 [Legionella sp.]
MSDFKSKLPDFKEVTSMATKLFKDVKISVCEIIEDYKKKREKAAQTETTVETKKTEVKVAKKSTAPKNEKVETTTVKTKKKVAKPPKNDASKKE